MVDTVEGQIPIKELVGKTGLLYCYDIRKKRKVISKFSHVRMTQKQAMVYAITLEDGTVIKATAEHLVYTKRGWIMVKNLRESDFIIKIG